MKTNKIILLLVSSFVLFIFGCSDDSSDSNPIGLGGLGGAGNGNLAITVSFVGDQQGGGIFSGKATAAITVTKITASLPALQYTESAQFDGVTVVNANVATEFLEYPAGSGIQSGQQWTFVIEGTLANDGQTYNVTSNYTIP